MSTPLQEQAVIASPAEPRPRRAHLLWHRLLALAVAAIVPIALIAGVGAAVLLKQQRALAEGNALDFTRAFANAIEAELGRSIAVLGVLASTPVLDRGDPAAFRDLAMRVLATLPDWRSVVLHDAAGRTVVHTSFPNGSPPASEEESLLIAVAERRPIVGFLRRGPRGEWGIPVRYPVMRDGEVRYVISGVLKPEAVLAVIKRQRLPDDWVVTVFDARDVRIARSRAHETSVGLGPSPELKVLMGSSAPEGLGITDTIDGQRVYTAYVRLPDARWAVAGGLPTSAFDADLRKAVAAYGGAIVFSLLLAIVLALRFANRINRPMEQLRDIARQLGSGGAPPQVAQTDIVEVNDVAQTLVEAARARLRGEAEREALLGAERGARAAAEAARNRLELLAESGARLARSLEPQATLQAVAHTIVPALVDWCNIDLADDDGHLQRALVHHADPQRRSHVHALLLRTRPLAAMEGTMAWAVQTGGSHLVRYDTPEAIERIPDADFRAIAQAMEIRAHFVVPLVARGRTIGAMAAAQAESGRDLGPDDLALITELAQRAALAIDNSRLYAQAENSRAQSEAANRAKDEFLAMLGHELRNPLAPIVTALELMKLRHADIAQRERGIIERQVRHLSRLVDDLLDVARIAQGKVQLERRRTDLRAVVDRALELTGPALAGREGIVLDMPDQPVCVNGDEVRLVQVVCNLLANAVKFTPPTGAIGLRVEPDDDAAVLTVTDAGRGIERDLLPHVFDLFVQAEQDLDRRTGGLGLGLGIVKMLVEMHSGTVEAHSAGIGRGSRFVVRLPRVRATAAAAGPAAPHQAAGPALAGRRVLIVDDNVDAAQSLAALLRAVGCEAREVHDGRAALAAVDEGFVPDIALLDIGLPGMTGYELAARLRRDSRLPGLVLVALTGYGREPDRARALAFEFDEHLVKPVSFDALLEAVARHLAR